MKNAAFKSTYLLWGCLAALVFLPLLTVGLLYLGILSERERFAAYSSVATQLQAIQDAEVDFSLARRASQAYLRIGDPVDREAMRSLIEGSRQKIAAARSTGGNEPNDAMLTALDAQLARYDQISQSMFDLVGRRRVLVDQRLRTLANQIDGDLAEYASRWQRGGLNAVAASLANARAAIADPRLRATYRPEDLAAAVARPLALAATVEIAEPDAAAIVRRVEARLAAFVAGWRELIEVGAQIASLADNDVLAIGQTISSRFEALADASTARQASLYQASQRASAGDDMLVSIVAAATLLAAVAGAFAASRLFAQQAARMRNERARRKALETVLSQLEAAAKSGAFAARAPETAPIAAAMPEPEPEATAEVPMTAPAMALAVPQPAEPTPQPAAAPEAVAARAAPKGDPTNDDLIKMLLASLPATPARNAN
ncbi:MAG: hypothetical protein ING44_18620 [Telmatospirillum sp.]|nr:hypothetical protein [Telmatospirillum sp.]